MSEDPAAAQTAQPPTDSAPPPPSPAAPLADAAARLREIPDYLEYLITAKLNQLRLWFRRLRRAVYLSFLLLIGVATAAGTGVFLLCRGTAEVLGELVGRPWLGDLLTGAVLLMILALGVPFVMARAARL